MIKETNKRTCITLTEEGQRALKDIRTLLTDINTRFDYNGKVPNDSKIINQALINYLKYIRSSYMPIDENDIIKDEK